MIKVLIVDDSPTVRLFLEYILSSDPEIEVVGILSNGKQAVEQIKKYKPDIITMDIDMPVMNGLEATRQIMSTNPVPIIIVTASRNAKKMNTSMEALAAGALTVVQKPGGFDSPDNEFQKKRIIKLIKTYSQVKVIKRRFLEPNSKTAPDTKQQFKANNELPTLNELRNRKYIAIGISTGGPEILKQLFENIPELFPVPILVVQHITDGFLESMVSWLGNYSKATLKIAVHGEFVLPGKIYFAPNNFHMGLISGRINLQKNVERSIICPSASYLFNSLAENYGKDTIAMLLTGMGSDGSKELKKLKDAGALTFAQDKESSLVFGMPGEAIKINAANYILTPQQLIDVLTIIDKRII